MLRGVLVKRRTSSYRYYGACLVVVCVVPFGDKRKKENMARTFCRYLNVESVNTTNGVISRGFFSMCFRTLLSDSNDEVGTSTRYR